MKRNPSPRTPTPFRRLLIAVALALGLFSAQAARPELWLFIGHKDMPGAPLVAGSVAWMAESEGALCDSYFETVREGGLFAPNGSTILGGRHFQDFNYLCCRADVKIVRYGATGELDSSIAAFGLEILADAATADALYAQLLAKRPALRGRVKGTLRADALAPARLAYLYPEVGYARRLFLPRGVAAPAGVAGESVSLAFPPNQDWGAFTKQIAAKWKGAAKCVFFGDPAALACRVPAELRRRSVPLYGRRHDVSKMDIRYSAYTENECLLAPYAAELALALGDRVIYGRQTCDADIFCWSRYGCCVQILDPYRPAFPCIDRFPQPWAKAPLKGDPAEGDPSDAQLRQWAKENKILTTLVWHSGEIAHNEAMLNVIEFAQINRFKMGIGVHAQRYETCPQLWELLRLPANRGGAAEYIEPVIHSGGLGVMGEAKFPPALFKQNLAEAKRRIAAVAGPEAVPTGYYAFMDSDLRTSLSPNPAIWKAADEAGMEYFITCSNPGRNKLLYKSGTGIVLNQSYRVLEAFSPFVRISTETDVIWGRSANAPGPGWRIGALDAPVIALAPSMWETGNHFKAMANALKTGASWGQYVNVKPRVIARYARILDEMGYIPASAKVAEVPPASGDANGK